MKEAPLQTIRRRLDEPVLQIGDTVIVEEGVMGVVRARYPHSSHGRNEVRYLVEIRPQTKNRTS